MRIIFRYQEEQCVPMEYERVKWLLDEVCKDLTALGKSGRLRTHNRIKNELGTKTEPIDSDGIRGVEERYQAILNARAMLREIEPALRKVFAENNAENKMLDKQGNQPANDSRKKRETKFTLNMSQMCAIFCGSILGFLFAKLFCFLCSL